MRENWEIRKLGDVCKLYQPKTISNKEFVDGGEYPVYGSNGVIGQYNQYNHAEREILISCRGTCGRVNVSKPFSWINGNAMVVHITNPALDFDFLKYQLMGVDMSEVITGATIPQITRQSLTPIRIAIPPIQEQETIVAELDCLTGIIEKKKQQLEELDNLAQSIFYDMFGDPITNEKEWEMSKVGDCMRVIGGYAFKSSSYSNSGYRLVQIANVWKDVLVWDEITYISFDDNQVSPSFILKKGDVLMAMTRPVIKSLSSVKIAVVREEDTPCLLNQRVCKFVSDGRLSITWFYNFARTEYFKDNIVGFGSKGMQPNVSAREIESIKMFLPPRYLQDLFAEKIEAIEKQKELVKRSIVETETLFNSRMDYWFN